MEITVVKQEIDPIHELTLGQWVRREIEKLSKEIDENESFKFSGQAQKRALIRCDEIERGTEHRRAVENALEDGLDVPEQVLADYGLLKINR